jgi:hypothetical protein
MWEFRGTPTRRGTYCVCWRLALSVHTCHWVSWRSVVVHCVNPGARCTVSTRGSQVRHEHAYDRWRALGQSKLAALLHARERRRPLQIAVPPAARRRRGAPRAASVTAGAQRPSAADGTARWRPSLHTASASPCRPGALRRAVPGSRITQKAFPCYPTRSITFNGFRVYRAIQPVQ